MNTFRMVQTAAQAIAEAISEGIASSALSAEGAAFTYSATAEEGRWAITITDLHPRGGRLSQGMLAGIAKQIAAAAERKAGAPSAQPAAAAQTTATPTPAEEEPAEAEYPTQTEDPAPTATAQTTAEPTATLSAQEEPAETEEKAPKLYAVLAADALCKAAMEGMERGAIPVGDYVLNFHTTKEGEVTFYKIDYYGKPGGQCFAGEDLTELYGSQIYALANHFYATGGPVKKHQSGAGEEVWYDLEGFSKSWRYVCLRKRRTRVMGLDNSSAIFYPAGTAQPTATPTAQDDPDAMSGLARAIAKYFAAQDPPEGYTIKEYQPPIEGGIGHYLSERIHSDEKRTCLMDSNHKRHYFLSGSPELEVEDADAGHGLRRISAKGLFGGRLLIMEMVERGGTPTGIARCWQGDRNHAYGEDWYQNGLLTLSQRWAQLSAEEYAAIMPHERINNRKY